MTHSDRIYQAAARAHESPPDEPYDYLADKPVDKCPWCLGHVSDDYNGLDSHHPPPWPRSCKWDVWSTVNQNRARYAREREADDKAEELMSKGSHGAQ